MNEGLLLLAIVLATIGAAIAVVWYRDLIFAPSAPARRPAPAKRVAQRAAAPAKPAEVAETPVSGIAITDNDPEMIAFRFVAKLIHAKVITQTDALYHGWGVRPGNTPAYKSAQQKMRTALDELDKGTT